MSVKHDIRTTIVTGIVCKKCKNELPPMTMEDHLESRFNTECPHTTIDKDIIYETPMMLYFRVNKEVGHVKPDEDVTHKWFKWLKLNKEDAIWWYLTKRQSFTQSDEEYASVKELISIEKELNKDITKFLPKLFHETFGGLW